MATTSGVPVAKRNEVSVKIDADVYRLVRTVAAWKGVNVSEYLSEIVAPVVRKDMSKMQKEAAKEAQDAGDAQE